MQATTHDIRVTVINGIPYIRLDSLPVQAEPLQAEPEKPKPTRTVKLITQEQAAELHVEIDRIALGACLEQSVHWWLHTHLRDQVNGGNKLELLPADRLGEARAMLAYMASELALFKARTVEAEKRLIRRLGKQRKWEA